MNRKAPLNRTEHPTQAVIAVPHKGNLPLLTRVAARCFGSLYSDRLALERHASEANRFYAGVIKIKQTT